VRAVTGADRDIGQELEERRIPLLLDGVGASEVAEAG
jgi:hypothetical protein